MKVGFIGTGSIGNPMAANLLAAGHELSVHDRRPEATANLAAAGATVCGTPADVAREADAVLMSLPSHLEVDAVCSGPDGVFSTIRPGTYLIDLTTVSVSLIPTLAQAADAAGVRYLTSPVSQGVDNAHAGQLSVFVGGDAADLARCRPLFDAIATVVIHTGDHFSAVSAKLLTNLLWYINAAAIGEALVIGARSGIDLPTLRDVIVNSCGTSWVADHDIPSIYDGSFDPTFTTGLCCKDLRLISELATQLNIPTELGSTVQQIFRRAENIYGADSPELSVVRNLQEITNTDLQAHDE
jgi:3-hydroxyisobutyrate dehydrogenase